MTETDFFTEPQNNMPQEPYPSSQTTYDGQNWTPPVKQRIRRVGSFTMGVALICAGILALICMFYPNFDMATILKFSPVILILLGCEVLISCLLFSKDKLKYDFLSAFFCFVLICASVGISMIQPLYTQYGPRRHSMENSISTSIDSLCYEKLKDIPGIVDVRSEVYLNDYLGERNVITYHTLRSTDHANLNVELMGEFQSPEQFAQACKPILDRVRSFGIDFKNISFYYESANKESQNGYQLSIGSRFQMDMDTAALSKLIRTDQ